MGVGVDHLQKANAPAMVPLAIAVGNRTCANCVKGYDKTKNSKGGMTSLKRSMGR